MHHFEEKFVNFYEMIICIFRSMKKFSLRSGVLPDRSNSGVKKSAGKIPADREK